MVISALRIHQPVQIIPVCHYGVDDTVVFGLLAGHEKIAVGVCVDLFDILLGVLRKDRVEALLDVEDLFGLDRDIRGLSLRAAQRLVDHDSGIGQGITFAGRPRCQEDRPHTGGLANAHRGDIRADVLHGVVDGQSGRHQAPRRVDVKIDILFRIFRFKKQHLSNEQIGDLVIYGGAQKNVGPAGVAFVIIKNDILGKVDRPIPSMLNYSTYIDNGSLYNTPSCLAVYGCLLMLRWLKDLGGVKAIHKINVEKAKMLYDEIDRNKLFKPTVDNEEDRSIMNVPFVMVDEYKEKEADFLQYAISQGMVGIKGHRSVGGFRASIYNAVPVESVKALITAMKEFEAKI